MTSSDPTPPHYRSVGRDPQRRAAWQGLDQSAVMTVELVVAVLLYGGLGLLVDRWLGTGPWFASIGTLVGFGAGLYLIWLRSERTGKEPDADEPGGRY
jgi:ATP synthase protein I